MAVTDKNNVKIVDFFLLHILVFILILQVTI